MTGIYKITNQCNGMSYVRQSIDIQRRWAEHRRKMNIKNTLLYQAMREFGIDNFSFEVIEECELVDLNDKEKYYIDKYNTMNPNGYNMSTIENIQHKINWDIANEIISELKNTSLTGKEIAKKYNVSHCLISQINNGNMWKQKNFVYPIRKREKKEKQEKQEKIWKCPFTREELEKKYNLSHSWLSQVNQGKMWFNAELNYPLRPIIKNEKISRNCIDCGKPITKGAKRCEVCSHKASRTVKRPDRETLKNLIRTQPFTTIAITYGVSDNAVRKWCKFENLPFKKREINNYSDEEWKLI